MLPGDIVRFTRRCVPGMLPSAVSDAYEYEVEIRRPGLILAVVPFRDVNSAGQVYIVLFSGNRLGWFAPREITVHA